MADPSPSLLVIALRIVGALLAVELLWLALLRHPELRRASPLGTPAVMLSGAAGALAALAIRPQPKVLGELLVGLGASARRWPPPSGLAVVALPAVLGRGPLGSIAVGAAVLLTAAELTCGGTGRAAGAAGAHADRGDASVARGGRLCRRVVGTDGTAAGGSQRGGRGGCGGRGGHRWRRVEAAERPRSGRAARIAGRGCGVAKRRGSRATAVAMATATGLPRVPDGAGAVRRRVPRHGDRRADDTRAARPVAAWLAFLGLVVAAVFAFLLPTGSTAIGG